MRTSILISIFLTLTSFIFSQTPEDVCKEMNNLKGNSISNLREYLVLRAVLQEVKNKASLQDNNFYRDSIIIDGIPYGVDFNDSISVSNYTKLILEVKIKQIFIQRRYNEVTDKWSNLVSLSTSHKKDKVYNISGDKIYIVIPAFSSGWFDTRKIIGECIKTVPFEPFHYDITIENISNSSLANDEMYVTLICRSNNYIIGYYLK